MTLRSAHLLVQKQVALKHARSTPTTLKILNWSLVLGGPGAAGRRLGFGAGRSDRSQSIPGSADRISVMVKAFFSQGGLDILREETLADKPIISGGRRIPDGRYVRLWIS